MYLFGLHVLYDLKNGIYTKGAGGFIEVVINLMTLAFSIISLHWAWSRRTELLAGLDAP